MAKTNIRNGRGKVLSNLSPLTPGPLVATTTNIVNKRPVITGTANQITVVNAADNSTSTISLAGNIVNPNQPLFLAYLSTNEANQTGDGTVYTIIYDTIVTNQGSNYSGVTGIFTAPTTGNYSFNTCNYMQGGQSANGFSFITLVTTAASYQSSLTITTSINQLMSLENSFIVPMSASDTAKITIVNSVSTKTAIIQGSASPRVTFFSGVLLNA